jgi:hypothetical protein
VATGGQHRKVVREPSVTIQGPSSVQEELAEPLSATFRALTGDLRSPTAVWSAPGATVQASGLNATITWPSFQGPGQSKSVYVTITDADALTAKASKSVLLKAANSHSVEGD